MFKTNFLNNRADDSLTETIELKKLHTVSEKLLMIDVEAFYLSLYTKLAALCDVPDDVFTKEKSPLLSYRLLVDVDGMISVSEKKEDNLLYSRNEVTKILAAIYQLAYAYTLDRSKTSSHCISHGITPLLMRPLLNTYKTPEAIQLNALLR